MARRRKKNTQIFAYVLLVIFLSVVGVGFYEFKKQVPELLNNVSVGSGNELSTGTSSKPQQEPYIYVNSILSGEGIIKQIPYNMQVSTSYQLIFSGKKFFAKSDNYLLADYLDKKIAFSGIIIGFSPENIPVININFVKDLSSSEENDNSLKTIRNKWYNLIVDLSDMEGFKIITGNNLIIAKISNSNCTGNDLSGKCLTGEEIPYLKVSAFKCNPSNPMTDCDSLKSQFQNLNFDKITNSNGVVFYKLPETNNYEVLGSEYGYYFYPLSGNFYSLINAFALINTKENKLQAIKNTCKNNNIQLSDILKIISTGDNYSVIGFDQNSNKVICKLILKKSGSTYVSNLQSLDYLRKDTSNNDVLNPNDYLVYKSRAYGFSVYMPKWVKYESDLVNKNFGVSGLNCLQVVNIAHRKKGNLSDPDVKVYYCKTEISKYLIENALSVNEKNYKVISKDSKKVFIILYKDNSIAKKIINYLKVF